MGGRPWAAYRIPKCFRRGRSCDFWTPLPIPAIVFYYIDLYSIATLSLNSLASLQSTIAHCCCLDMLVDHWLVDGIKNEAYTVSEKIEKDKQGLRVRHVRPKLSKLELATLSEATGFQPTKLYETPNPSGCGMPSRLHSVNSVGAWTDPQARSLWQSQCVVQTSSSTIASINILNYKMSNKVAGLRPTTMKLCQYMELWKENIRPYPMHNIPTQRFHLQILLAKNSFCGSVRALCQRWSEEPSLKDEIETREQYGTYGTISPLFNVPASKYCKWKAYEYHMQTSTAQLFISFPQRNWSWNLFNQGLKNPQHRTYAGDARKHFPRTYYRIETCKKM